MKKTGLMIAILALAAAGASADGINFNGWGRSVLFPYVSRSGGDAQATIGNSYGNVPEFGINAVGSSANVGFEYDFKYTGGNIATGNNAFVWVAPFEGTRLALGIIKDWTLMSNATLGDWDFVRLSYTGENFTFSRINVEGAELSYTQGPLFAYATLDNLLYGSSGAPASVKLADLMKNLTVGAGFKWDEVGTLKAQALGYANASKNLYEIVNIGFDFTAVENLWASAGVFINTDASEHAFGNDSKVTGLLRADFVASYTLGSVKISGLTEYVTHKTGDPNLEFGAGFDYNLDDGLSVLGDVRYLNKVAGAQHLEAPDAVTGGFIGVNKSFGTGNVGIGIAYSSSTFATWSAPLVPTASAVEDAAKAHFAIPVRVDYSF